MRHGFLFFCVSVFALVTCESGNGAEIPLPRTQQGFPAKPIRILVHTGPGGLIDFTARKFAERATIASGVPFVVINKPGAGGVVAFEELLSSNADGYTLLAVARSNLPKLIASDRTDLLGRVNWAAKLLDDPQCVIVNLQTPANDWASIVTNARQMDGRQLWLGPDIGGLDHISAMKIQKAAGIQARWIPYESGGQAIAALLGGLGATYTGNPSEVRGRPDLAIAGICTAERLPQFPDAPTFKELGLVGLEEESMWRGFACHPELPEEIRSWYDSLFERITNDITWREEWEKDGLQVGYEPSSEFEILINKEIIEFTDFLQSLEIISEPGHISHRTDLLAVQILIALSLTGFVGSVLAMGRIETAPWRWRASQWVPVTGFGLLVWLGWNAASLPPGNELDPVGPAGIPLLWMFLLLPCLITIAWNSCRREIPVANSEDFVTSLSFAGLLTACLFFTPIIGYYLAAAATLPLVLFLLGWRKLMLSLCITVGWLLFVFFVFQKMLHVDLPVLPRF